MSKKALWLSWYSLYILCVLFGSIPDPQGFWRAFSVLLSILFFVPGALLLKWAKDRDQVRTLRQIRGIAIGSLTLTAVLIMINFASALMSDLWGDIFYGILVVVSCPMVCSRYWALSLFGWACIMVTSVTLLRKREG